MSGDDQAWNGEGASAERDVAHDDETADVIAMLVAKCLELRGDDSGEIPLEEVCKDHPELVEEVRSSIKFVGALPRLQSFGPTGDPMLRSKLAGRYRIDSRLGSGAMGVVYSATDLDLSRRVAVKVVHSRFLDASEAVARFDREAEALAAISHESVVTIHDRGITESGAPFLVMEFIDGLPCSEILSRAERHKATDTTDWLGAECGIEYVNESSLVRLMVRWMASLASGLGAAHSVGVYHRDVKPSNIMIRRDGRAVLLDFGIASLESDETMTRADSAIGTPAYMAPEALLGGSVRLKSAQDVYGVAATLYHLLTLKAPYQGTPSEVLAALAVREPEPASSVRPGLPRDAQAILDHGLARSPGHRYESLGAMEKDLRALLAFQPVSVSPTGSMTRAFRRLRRSKVAVGAIAASLLIAGVLGAQNFRAGLAAKREDVFEEAYAHVPANLGVVGPANRSIADEALRAGVADVLDRLVDSGHQKVTATMLRAAFRLDHGDVDGAKADMRLVEAAAGTEYARELARRYDALPGTSHSALDLNLEALPDASAPLDSYLAAYHAMRTNRYGEAVPLLEHGALNELRHAKELELILVILQFNGLDRKDDIQPIMAVAERLYSGAVRLEESFGYVSAQSAHLRGFAAAKVARHVDALRYCEEGLELSGASHATLLNAAECARKRNELDRSRAYLVQGFRILPNYLKLRKVQWDIEWNDGNFDTARELIMEADFSRERSPEDSLNFELGRVHLMEAIVQLDMDAVRSKAAAEEALSVFSRLPDTSRSKAEFTRHAEACLSGDKAQLFDSFVDYLIEDPLSRAHIAILRTILPKDLSELASASVLRWISALEQEVALPGRLSTTRR